jgi:hypothetical protein
VLFVKRILGFLLVVIGLGAGASDFYLINYYASVLPRSQIPEEGRVIPMNDHGVVIFLNKTQDSLVTWLQVTAVIVAAVGGLLIKFDEKTK